jgi:hypothetical protein
MLEKGRGPPPFVTGLGSPREGSLARERLAAEWRAARPRPLSQFYVRRSQLVLPNDAQPSRVTLQTERDHVTDAPVRYGRVQHERLST